ncbi:MULTISPECIES: hypothetical protein [Acidianus]|uniref:DUF4352 domain-containing protein n=1 Tax=Candidatus Acidianus copahuensis TaxID=1160895 RepID=A0A031LTU8_9CREN|nr:MULTISPECIES: hypothetical protein [Acidianus]EZQ11165.1 hypothetical protein CM19_02650 [Candidatus Acidianus copahuensis]NON62660.1 hypothetical protein [Acidianus sp. RZ1]
MKAISKYGIGSIILAIILIGIAAFLFVYFHRGEEGEVFLIGKAYAYKTFNDPYRTTIGITNSSLIIIYAVFNNTGKNDIPICYVEINDITVSINQFYVLINQGYHSTFNGESIPVGIHNLTILINYNITLFHENKIMMNLGNGQTISFIAYLSS